MSAKSNFLQGRDNNEFVFVTNAEVPGSRTALE
jgi:hypothetical protein